MCSLRSFLKTGKLGEIQLGVCLEDVRNILDKPKLSTQVKPNIDIWKYDDLELTFDNGTIKQIKIGLSNTNPKIPNKLAEDVWQVNQSMKIEELLDLIDNYEISWRVNEKWSFDRQLCLVTEGKVFLFLDLDRREFQSLVVVS